MAAKSEIGWSPGLCLWAILATATLIARPAGAQDVTSGKRGDLNKSWQAVAPGVIEPRSGEIKISTPVISCISQVLVKINDRVLADEPLVRLDDESARARVASAQAQVAMRERARNEQKAAGKAENRRNAEDAVADAEEALVDARSAFDKAAIARRTGSGSDAAVTSAHHAWTAAQENLERQRTQLRKIETQSGTPLPTLAEGELNIARDDLRVSLAELEKLTIRAPIASTVLQVNAKAGELAAPTSRQPLLILGDLSRLRVRAELDEHDIGKIKLGDPVVVRADAFPGRTFSGSVSSIAPLVQPAHLNQPGSRNRSDFSVTEVLIDLADSGPLMSGMSVDVYFETAVPEQKAK